MNFRLFAASDLDLYLRWINQREIWRVDNPGPYQRQTKETFAQQWQRIVGWERSWMMLLEDRPIGYIGLISDADGALTNEFFIVIGEIDEWGRGHGCDAMEWLFGKARALGLQSLIGQVLGNNERALGFYESLGFRITGRGAPEFKREGGHYQTIYIERALPSAPGRRDQSNADPRGTM